MKIKYDYLIFTIAILSVILRMFLLHPTFSDDIFYFNAAKVFISGHLPYRDFFFAQPPFELFLFGAVFEIFGTAFLVAKSISLIFSTLSFVLVFFVGKTIFDEKTAFVSSIVFFISPAFLAFSLVGEAVFFAMSLLLLSLFFYVKGKNVLAAILFVFALYVRYLVAPFILFFLILNKVKFRRFFILVLVLSILLFASFCFAFGLNYFQDTALFHISSKIGSADIYNKEPYATDYWKMNFSFIILSIAGIAYGIWKKEKSFVLFASFPLVIDSLLLIIFKFPYVYYFILTLPFFAFSVARLFVRLHDKILRILIFGIIILAVFENIPSFDYYLNPLHASKFFEISDFISQNTNSSDKIIGEPAAASYVAFTRNISLPLEYTDSFLQHVRFENPSDLVAILDKEKPKFFIESHYLNSSYYFIFPEIKNYVINHYVSVLNITGIPSYYLYQVKS
jgi:hypothetical protein